MIVIVDDDTIYRKDMVETLLLSYLAFPHAVSANRTHYIMPDEAGNVSKYADWIGASCGGIHLPSMRHCPIGCSGVLYPPHLLDLSVFDRHTMLELAPVGDDLLLKCASLVNDVPAVLAGEKWRVQNIPGSQDVALWQNNVHAGGNDEQWAALSEWFDRRYYPGVLRDKLFAENGGEPTMIEFIKSLAESDSYLIAEKAWDLRKAWREKAELAAKLRKPAADRAKLNARLKQAEEEREALRVELQQAQRDSGELQAQLRALREQRDRLNRELDRSRKRLKQSEAERAAQEKTVARLQSRQQRLKASASYRIGRLITAPVRWLRRLFK